MGRGVGLRVGDRVGGGDDFPTVGDGVSASTEAPGNKMIPKKEGGSQQSDLTDDDESANNNDGMAEMEIEENEVKKTNETSSGVFDDPIRYAKDMWVRKALSRIYHSAIIIATHVKYDFLMR